MALGRIGGGVLKDDLLRNGSNLNFKNNSGSTALLHLDVINSRVGINTESPAATYSLDIPTPLASTNLVSDNANIQNWTLDTNRIYQNSGDINLSGSSNVFLSGLLTDNMRVNFNTFESLANANINLTPNGTGTVEIYSDWNSDGNIHATGNITFGGDLVLGDDDTDSVIFNSDLNSHLLPDVNDVSELGTSTKRWNQLNVIGIETASINTGQLSIDTNVIRATQTDTNLNLDHTVNGKKVDIEFIQFEDGTMSTSGITMGLNVTDSVDITSTQALKLPAGTTTDRPSTEGGLRFNNTYSLFEGRSNTGYSPFGGVISDDAQTQVTASSSDTLEFKANNVASGSIDSTGANLTGLQVDDISMQGSSISVMLPDLNLVPHGSGTINIDNINFNGTTITNNTNSAISFTPTGYGYEKIQGTNGVVIPYGTTAQRWPNPQVGDTRFNTDTNTLEAYNGSTYTQASGAGGTLSLAEMNDLALQFTIILG